VGQGCGEAEPNEEQDSGDLGFHRDLILIGKSDPGLDQPRGFVTDSAANRPVK
jgi:hypothetical protein